MFSVSPVHRSHRGASFTEYLIVVAAIALVSLGVFALFGDVNRQHTANITQELAGTASSGVINRGDPSGSFGAGAGGGSYGGGNSGNSSGGGSKSPGAGTTGGNSGDGSGSEGSSGSGSGSGNSGGNAGGSGAGSGSGSGGSGDGSAGTGGGSGSVGGVGGGGSGWTPGTGGDNSFWDPVVDPGNGAGGEFCEVPGGNAPTLAYVGNPINLASGNKFQRETDYRGKGEFPLVLERSYNSLLSHENSTLGAGWQHNYDRRISEQEDGLLRVVRADGRRHLFRRDGQYWVSTDGNVDRLIDHVRNEQHLGWHYFPGTGGEEHFDSEGRLQRLIHTYGQQQNLNYNEHGLLHSVTDAYGEQLRFHYQDTKLIRSVCLSQC